MIFVIYKYVLLVKKFENLVGISLKLEVNDTLGSNLPSFGSILNSEVYSRIFTFVYDFEQYSLVDIWYNIKSIITK